MTIIRIENFEVSRQKLAAARRRNSCVNLRFHDLAHDNPCSSRVDGEDGGADVDKEHGAILLVDVEYARLRNEPHG